MITFSERQKLFKKFRDWRDKNIEKYKEVKFDEVYLMMVFMLKEYKIGERT